MAHTDTSNDRLDYIISRYYTWSGGVLLLTYLFLADFYISKLPYLPIHCGIRILTCQLKDKKRRKELQLFHQNGRHKKIPVLRSRNMYDVSGLYPLSNDLSDSTLRTESRKVLKLPPVTIFPYQNLPPVIIFEVRVVDRAWLRRGSRYKLRENILVSFHMGLN